MKKKDLLWWLEGFDDDDEIVLRASATSLAPLWGVEKVKAMYRPAFGLYREINDDGDFTEAQKTEVQNVVLLRS